MSEETDELAAREQGASFSGLVGIEYTDDDPGHTTARIPVRAELLQPFGIVHGGVMSTLIESVTSRATTLVVLQEGMAAMGQSITVNFMRPISEGTVEVLAHARHRGRTTWVWDAEVRDSQDRLCALAQMTIAVRPLPKG